VAGIAGGRFGSGSVEDAQGIVLAALWLLSGAAAVDVGVAAVVSGGFGAVD